MAYWLERETGGEGVTVGGEGRHTALLGTGPETRLAVQSKQCTAVE